MKNKNIWLLPTDKPSKLRINSKGKLILSSIEIGSKGETQNIYITNDEEIKKGDWVTNGKKNAIKCYIDWFVDFFKTDRHIFPYKKIILTTSEDLIKDGVQAIDDEFLEWFVKNPSCDCIEVQKWFDGLDFLEYKIIIPKEKAKGVIDIPKITEECGFPKEIWKPKQETLEEVAERILDTNEVADGDMILSDTFSKVVNSMIEIAKWQQEQDNKIYSEEDMKDYALKCISNYLFGNDFISDNLRIPIVENNNKQFEQFKKK